jgi:hypothetical protein
MKKFLTLITLVGLSIPAIQGLSADVQKKYDNLKSLIQNADVATFKSTFDALESVEKAVVRAELEQSVVEAKAAINKEIETLGDSNKNWSMIIKGSLATLCGISGIASIYTAANTTTGKIIAMNAPFRKTPGPIRILAAPPVIFSMISNLITSCLSKTITGKIPGVHDQNRVIASILGVTGFTMAYKSFPYAIKNLKAGLNYKQYLQDQIINLDAIAAHIAQAK